MNKFWVTSDSHVRHKNIVRGISDWERGYRDFDTQDDHDKAVIDAYNSCMDEGDTLIHGGDWVFGDKHPNLVWFLSQLKVKNIISCVGNHDKYIVLKTIFGENVHKIYDFKYKGKQISVCHFPIEHWLDMECGSLHLFGHLHSNPKKMRGRSMDIGLDGNNMRPYLLDDVVDFLSSQPICEPRHS